MVQLSRVTEPDVVANYAKTELGMLIEHELTVREMSLGQFATLSGVDKSTVFRLIKGIQGRVHDTTLKRLAAALNQPENELRLLSRIPAAPVPERLRRHFAEAAGANAPKSIDAEALQKRIGKMISRLVEMLVKEPEQDERRILADLVMKLNSMQIRPVHDDREREFIRQIEEAYPVPGRSFP